MMPVLNLGHGPEKDEGMRYLQLSETVESIFKYFSHDSFPLFEARASDILQDMGDNVEVGDSASPQEALWKYLKAHAPLEKKEYPTTFCRFMAFVRDSRKLLSRWTWLMVKVTFLALETDALSGRLFVDRALVSAAAVEHFEAMRSTTQHQTLLDAKMLRNCTQNNVVISALVLGCKQHRRMLAIIVHCSTPIDVWHGKGNARCKAVRENRAWSLEQLGGAFMENMLALFDVLLDPVALADCGFMEFKRRPADEKECGILIDDEFAEKQGSLALELIAARERRTLYYMMGWPHKMNKVSLASNCATQVITELRADAEAKRYFDDQPKDKHMLLVHERSLFNLVAVQQWLAACEQSGFKLSSALEELAAARTKLINNTQLIEAMIGLQKKRNKFVASSALASQNTLWGVVLARKLLDKKHKYSTVSSLGSLVRRTQRLTKEAFGKRMQKPTLNLEGIQTTTAKAPYFSPLADNVSTPTADLPLIRMCFRHHNMQLLHDAFLGVFCVAKSKLIFRNKGSKDDAFDWVLPLTHFHTSSALAMPCHIQPLPNAARFQQVVPKRDIKEPTVIPIVSWQKITARPYKFRSWAWQHAHIPNADAHVKPGTRLIVDGPEESLSRVLAKAGWGNLQDTTILGKVAGHLGLKFDASWDVLTAQLELTTQVLKISRLEALDILRPNVMISHDVETIEALLEIDEVLSLVFFRPLVKTI